MNEPTLEQLLEMAQDRLPGFRISLQMAGKGIPIMSQWGYDFRAPIMAWQRSRPAEMPMGGVYPSMRDCLMAVLSRVDRFDAWVKEQKVLAAQLEAKVRAQRAALAAPVLKPEVDEGDEPAVEAEALPDITPLPEELLVAKTDGKPSLS
jgi:hypothetical protein